MAGTIQTGNAPAELKEFVRSYAQREIECCGTVSSNPILRLVEHILSFDFS